MDDLLFGLGIGAVGMSLVFALLGLLWLVLTLIGRLDATLLAREEAGAAGAGGAAGPGAPGGEAPPALEPGALAAIALAVAAHATLLRRQAAPAQRSTQPGSQIYASRWLAAGRTRQTGSFTPRR